jgi:hypothetical protein
MQAQQDNKSSTETSGSSKKNISKENDEAVFETYASQCKIKPYPKPRGPLAQNVVSGGSLPDTKPAVQMKTEEEEPLHGKGLIQKSEEEKPLQGKGNIQLAGEKKSQTKPNNTGLPDNLKSGIENLSGYAMDDIQVHYNSDKPSQLQAHAFTQGTDIHIAPSQEKHLPHEAWHVVQQKQGRVQPTLQMQGVGVNDSEALEQEATKMGEQAKSGSTNIPSAKEQKELKLQTTAPLKQNAYLLHPIQCALNTVTRRLEKASESDWKTLVKANGITDGDLKKIVALSDAALKKEYGILIDIDAELDSLTETQKTKTKVKNRIKDRIEGQYMRIIDLAKTFVEDANLAYNTRLKSAADGVAAFKAGTDRKFPAGGKIKPNESLKKHEKDGPVKDLIAAIYGKDKVISWVTEDEFRTTVMAKYSEGVAALSAISATDNARLETEKTAINAQLSVWDTTAIDAPGTNDDGTWGTSAAGAGTHFAVSKVNAIVWAKLKNWWMKTPTAFVTPSDTSTYSLKMDRNPPDDALSPRLNYHINVG